MDKFNTTSVTALFLSSAVLFIGSATIPFQTLNAQDMATLGDNNMSTPFTKGELTIPIMCTTPNKLIGSLTGMFEENGEMIDPSGNSTQQMGQPMENMTGTVIMENMSEGELQEALNMTEGELQEDMNSLICSPTMGDEDKMQGMMGNNNMSSMMSGMMMQ
jgi:hypothetical protein